MQIAKSLNGSFALIRIYATRIFIKNYYVSLEVDEDYKPNKKHH